LIETPLVLRSKCFHGEKPILFRRPLRTASSTPKAISECGGGLFLGFASAVACRGVLMPASWEQVILIRMLESQPGPLMSGEVIFFAVILNADAVGMGGEVMVLSRYLV
jgi:hypothetical protein